MLFVDHGVVITPQENQVARRIKFFLCESRFATRTFFTNGVDVTDLSYYSSVGLFSGQLQ